MLDALMCSFSHCFAVGEYSTGLEYGDQIMQLYDESVHFNYNPHSVYNIASATRVFYSFSLVVLGRVKEGLEISKCSSQRA